MLLSIVFGEVCSKAELEHYRLDQDKDKMTHIIQELFPSPECKCSNHPLLAVAEVLAARSGDPVPFATTTMTDPTHTS